MRSPIEHQQYVRERTEMIRRSEERKEIEVHEEKKTAERN